MPCGCGKSKSRKELIEDKLYAPKESAAPNIVEEQGKVNVYGMARRSCLHCVEKHIGAAWVLFSEYKDNYPYKTLIIGHLHEAEEESESWQPLHDLIRHQRIQFQDENITPAFDFLSLKIFEVIQLEQKD